MENLEKFFEDIFTKKVSYKIPTGGKEWLVTWAPWLVIISVVLSIYSIIQMLSVGAIMGKAGFLFGVSAIPRYYLYLAVFAVQTLVIAASFPGLKSRHKSGWRMLYYATLISLIQGVLSSQNMGGVVWSVIGSAIGLYILFQIKDRYTEIGIPGTIAEKIDEKVKQVTNKIG